MSGLSEVPPPALLKKFGGKAIPPIGHWDVVIGHFPAAVPYRKYQAVRARHFRNFRKKSPVGTTAKKRGGPRISKSKKTGHSLHRDCLISLRIARH